MNWKVILQLAAFGLAMAIATVYVIPTRIESAAWIVVLLISAAVVALRAGRMFFLHGFLVGLANWISVTCSHVLLSGPYFARHASEAHAMTTAAPGAAGAIIRWCLRYNVPFPGASGVLMGFLAWAFSKLFAKRRVA